jgi:glutamate-ammonia-ligase adenylyltransferase
VNDAVNRPEPSAPTGRSAAAGGERQRETAHSKLAKAGFAEPEQAGRLLAHAALGELRDDPQLRDAVTHAADPDLALVQLVRLLEAAPDAAALRDTLAASKPLRDRLCAVLGASQALGDHLVRHPDTWHVLLEYDVDDVAPDADRYRTVLLIAVGAPPTAQAGVAPGADTDALDVVTGAATPTDRPPVAALTGDPARDALRVAYRRCLLGIAARDLCGGIDVATVAAELADLADATLEAALAVARAEQPADAAPCRIAVIGMGKCGGRELNYVSDVDVVFVAEPLPAASAPARDASSADAPSASEASAPDPQAAIDAAGALAAAVTRICSDTTAEGTIWPVDAALRPEGKAGPLVRTVASHLAYYQRWAKTWEFQALLKARPVAGDRALGQAYLDAVLPLVWAAADRPNFVEDVQAMRRRVVESVPAGDAARELKLGPGGLRDVEFAVQLLQLVHGRTDPTLRDGGTLRALGQLAAGGYVGRADAAALDDAYRYLRSLEHRLQLFRLRRTHTLPDNPVELRRIGRSLGYLTDPVTELTTRWRQHAGQVRRLHEKLFYRPLLAALSRLPTDEAKLTPSAAASRLHALGYADPDGALRHLEALTAGVSRRAAIQRQLLPAMLGWFADAADPDGGLLVFRKVSEALGNTPWYLRQLRDEGAAAQRLALVLASGRYAPDLLLRAPDAVAMLGTGDGLRPRGRDALQAEMLAAVGRADSPEQAVAAARAVRRRELFRGCAADVLGELTGDQGTEARGARPGGQHARQPADAADAAAADAIDDPAEAVDVLGAALSDITAATLNAALAAATEAVRDRLGAGTELPTSLAVIAVGRFGGRELNYGSDADVLFVHEPRPGADERAATDAAHAVANELRRLLQAPTPDPALLVDADLRPEGRQGPLVRSIGSYAAYYARWSQVWESQALLRAEPVAGDADLGRRFIELINPLRYPSRGLDEADLREIRRIKARVEAERLPRGADPALHTKLGPGGLADVEWTAQLIQLRHAGRVPRLRTTRTRAALRVAAAAGLIEADDATALEAAWTMASKVRNGITVVRGRPADSLPTDARQRAGIAHYVLGRDTSPDELLDEYLRATRRARAVVERVFYG